MIHLVARDAESAFGVQTILDTEKVPYGTAAGSDDDPLIA